MTEPSPEQIRQIKQKKLDEAVTEIGDNAAMLFALCTADAETKAALNGAPQKIELDLDGQLKCLSHAKVCQQFCERDNGGAWNSDPCKKQVIATVPIDKKDLQKGFLDVTCQHLGYAQNGTQIEKDYPGEDQKRIQKELYGLMAQLS